MKIAMIGHKRIPSREGGVEIVVEQLATRMVKKGHGVTCYNRSGQHVAGKEYSEKQKKEYKGVKLKKVFTINKKGLAAMTSSLFATIKALFSKANVVHYHAEGPCAMMWIIKWFSKKKIVATIHGLDWQRAKWGGFATKYIKFGEKMAVKYADEIIVLSENVKKYFKETYNRETVFIPNGVNKPKIIDASIITKKYNLEKDDYILYLGRIVPEKGIHYLIEAFSKTKTTKKLVIAGGASDTDSYYNEIKEMAKNDDRIIFTGFVQGKELEELFSNAYIYCLPSDLEGMPLSLLEAMSYGNCCLTSNIDECSEVLEDKGVTFEKSNVNDLEDKLNNLLKNKSKVKKYKENAQEFILNKYNWDDVVDNTVEVYKKPHKPSIINFEIILIFLLIISCSFQSILSSKFNHLDEILLLLLGGYEIVLNFFVRKEKLDIKMITIVLSFTLLTFLNVFIKNYSMNAYLEDFLNFIKIIILFEVFLMIKFDDKKYKKVIKIIFFISLISIFYGIFKYLFYDYFGYTAGDKFRNGHYRISGLSGHPISLGFLCLILAMYLLNPNKKLKKSELMCLIIVLIALYLTRSRLSTVLFIIYFVYYIIYKYFKNIKSFYLKHKILLNISAILLVVIISVIGFLNLEKINEKIKIETDNTIRMYSLAKSVEVFKKYPLLGTGIGTFSSSASIKYDSYVYEEFDINRFLDQVTISKADIFESTFAKILIQTGLVGVFFFGYFFCKYLKISFKRKNYFLIFAILFEIINLIFNVAYQIPFILIIAIILSRENFKNLNYKK